MFRELLWHGNRNRNNIETQHIDTYWVANGHCNSSSIKEIDCCYQMNLFVDFIALHKTHFEGLVKDWLICSNRLIVTDVVTFNRQRYSWHDRNGTNVIRPVYLSLIGSSMNGVDAYFRITHDMFCKLSINVEHVYVVY